MRVTFVLPGLARHPIGGYRVVYEYAARLAGRGHSVTVCHMRPPAHGARGVARRIRDWRSGATVREIGWLPLPRDVRLVLGTEGDPRVFPSAEAILATSWRTARVVLDAPSAAGNKYHLIQHYETWAAPADEVDAAWRLPLRKILISRWLLALARRLGVPDDQLHYIPNGLDTDLFRVIAPIGSRDPLHVGMLFHPQSWKGSDEGLAVLHEARRSVPELRVSMFGTVPRPPGLPSSVVYHKSPVGDALVQLYNSLAIFLHPSRTEGWPLPPAEAMSCGCALVASSNEGVLEYAVDERNALMAPVGDRQLLLRQLLRALTDDGLRISLARRGVDDIRVHDWERAVGAMEDVLSRR